MNDLNNPANRWTIERVPFSRLKFGGMFRLIAGIGINAIGAGVLLAEALRLAGLSI